MKKNIAASLIVVIALALAVGCAGCTTSTSPSPSPSTNATAVSNTTALGTALGNTTALGNATHLDVMQGQHFTIQLQSNPSTGYQWQPTYNTAAVTLVNQTYMAGSTSLLGAPGAAVFTFQGTKTGTSVITFNCVSPANQTTNSVNYTINCTTLKIASVNAVFVSNGTNFTIPQPSNPSTGYQWQLQYTNDTFTLVNQTFASNVSASSAVVGAGGSELWTFQTTATGSGGIILSEVSPANQTTTIVPYLVLVTS